MQNPLNERLVLFVKSLPRFAEGGTDTQIAQFLGVHKQVYHNIKKSERAVPIDVITKLVTHYGLNANWWATGVGPMLLSESPMQALAPAPEAPFFIPFYNLQAFASLVEVATDEREYIEAYIPVPKCYKGDAALRVKRQSMEPELHDGDIIIVREEHSRTYDHNQIYLVITEQLRTVKYISRDADKIRLQGTSSAMFQHIREEEIKRLFKVVYRVAITDMQAEVAGDL